ncbi:MAG: ASCH domain-containing protein [Alphaproteobacteria bacterium]|nr:ASCH domain-containing protein [Alphaproteobacteria bacterium]
MTQTVHRMRLHAEPFAQISAGKKQVELRLNDEKRQNISVGDTVIFTSRESGEELKMRVIGRVLFKDFRTLEEFMTSERCGFTRDAPAGYDLTFMDKIYSAADIAKFGALGLVIELTA